MKLYLRETKKGSFNAGFKARADVDAMLEERGFKPLNITIFDSGTSRLSVLYHRMAETRQLRRALAGDSDLFVQYPMYTYKGHLRMLKYIFGRHTGKRVVLVHDMLGYRNGGGLDAEFRLMMTGNTTVIAHTPAMARRIEADAGLLPGSVKVLNLFDYRTDDHVGAPTPDGKTVIFAGNLADCGFLRRLDEIKGISFNIYGIRSDHVRTSDTCRYCGKFEPERVSQIKGDWGLVWHGSELESSSGNIGEYLRIISSHKISLYIAACKPVILWNESSVAEFITANHLGIAVKSLLDIPAALAALTPQQKAEMAGAVQLFSTKLRAGKMLAPLI